MFLFRSVYLKTHKEFRSTISTIFGIGKHKAFVAGARLGYAFPLPFVRLNRRRLIILNGYLLAIVTEKIRVLRIRNLNVSRLIETGNFMGKRQKDNLPCRGQRTRTNASTRKRLKSFIYKA